MLWRRLIGDGDDKPVARVGAEQIGVVLDRAAGTLGTSPGAIDFPIDAWLKDLHASLKDDFSGTLANYIPELTKANPAHFGIAIATVDGHVYTVGDATQPFTIQSVSKPFVYGLALDDRGMDHVMSKVGVEPTGEAFNSIVMDEANNRPFNPMVNAGAIATTSLVRGQGFDDRFARMLEMFGRYAGRPLDVDESVFHSERETGHRNRAIAYLQLNSKMIEEPVLEHLDLYFRQCSVLVTAADLAMMAATLANNGVNPRTNAAALKPDNVKSVLSVMASAGMYDYSGEWIYRVGLPAKSGVGGGIIAVLPGQFGVGIYSPLLDANGNSARGIEVCKRLSERFRLHVFEAHAAAQRVVRRSYRGGLVTSKRRRVDREQRVLDSKGRQIAVYELQGDLYFASVEQLLRRIAGDAEGVTHVVLDGQRVSAADTSALLLLRDLARSLEKAGRNLLLAGFSPALVGEWTRLADRTGGPWLTYESVDLALETSENEIIAATIVPSAADQPPIALAHIDLFRGLTTDQVHKLETYVESVRYVAGDAIIREGDAADRLFLLAAGTAAVKIRLGDGERTARMAAFGPGVAFGEFAFFDGGKRTADVIAETKVTCYMLTFEAMKKLERQEPAIYNHTILALGRLLTDRLRRVTAEVRALA